MLELFFASCATFFCPLPDSPRSGDAHQADPVPNNAIARLGTVRYRLGAEALLTAFLSGTVHLHFDVSGGTGVSPWFANTPASPIALSADGKTLAGLGADGAVRLFDTATGKERDKLEMKVDPHFGYRLALSPDVKRLALGGTSQPTVLWSITEKKEIGSFAHADRALNTLWLEFTPDGKELLQGATSNDPLANHSLLIVWDVETRKEKRRIADLPKSFGRYFTHAVFSPDHSLMAFPFGNTIRLITLADGKEVRQLREIGRKVTFGEGLTFSADGKRLVALVHDTPIVFEVETGNVLSRIQARDTPTGVSRAQPLAISRDGKTIVFADRLVLRVFDLASGKEINLQSGNTDALMQLAFSVDGKTMVTMDSNEARVWEVATGKETRRVPITTSRLTRNLYPVCLSPDGLRLAVGRGIQGWRLIDAETGKEMQSFRAGEFRADFDTRLKFSPDGKTLAGYSAILASVVYLVDTTTGKVKHTLRLPCARVRRLSPGLIPQLLAYSASVQPQQSRREPDDRTTTASHPAPSGDTNDLCRPAAPDASGGTSGYWLDGR